MIDPEIKLNRRNETGADFHEANLSIEGQSGDLFNAGKIEAAVAELGPRSSKVLKEVLHVTQGSCEVVIGENNFPNREFLYQAPKLVNLGVLEIISTDGREKFSIRTKYRLTELGLEAGKIVSSRNEG